MTRAEALKKMLALSPGHVDLARNAPPRYRAEADVILPPALPKPTQVDQDGCPVFSLEQIVKKFGMPVEPVEALAEQHINLEPIYRGEVHAIQ